MSRNTGPLAKANRRARNERERLAMNARLAELRSIGASCGNCKHRASAPMYGPICELGSDHQGYQPVKLTEICTQWAALAEDVK